MYEPRFGLSMLYKLGQSFNEMTKQLGKLSTGYVEIVDDGWHTLNKVRVAKLKEAAKTFGLKYSVHAPFADINVASPSKTLHKASMKRLSQSLEYTKSLDAYLWVFHPGSKSGISSFYPGADWKQNLHSINRLFKTASDMGLEVAMENLPEKYNFLMKTPDDFKRFYEESGLEEIGIVLDTGHAHLENQVLPFLKGLPKKIVHVHVSDNHGVIDEHLGLGDGSINWQQFAAALKAADFSGTVIAESVFRVNETLQELKRLLV